ncbi:MAG TPA: hypothetical protein PLL95_09830, partial [Anaerolineales bacterium]|nr:hypothetical protein [Anaerolineales bacterium]
HFKFTNDDLEENRRGVLSKKQIKRIAYYERGGKIAFSLIGVLLLVFPIGFANTLISEISRTYQNEFLFKSAVWVWGVEITISVIFGLFLLAIGVAGVFLIVSQFLKIKPYKLVSIRGLARLEKGHGNRFSHVYYDLHINNQQFDGDSTLNKVIVQGAEYIVYYLESNAEIMSIEKVSNEMSVA